MANHANLELKTTPFGMSAWEWPGIHVIHNANIRRTFQEDGVMYTTCDMMKMEVSQLPLSRFDNETLTRSSIYETFSAMTSGTIAT